LSSSTSVDMWSLKRSDGRAPVGWFLIPLRFFLGWILIFAGIQKLANPGLLRTVSPSSIQDQLVGATHSNPIHALIGHIAPIAAGVGLVIALGELAIGVCVLVGLWTRMAAVAGFALSLALFLIANFHSSLRFTGSDIVLLLAWTPLAVAGAAGAPAVDTWLADLQPAERQAAPDRQGTLPRRALLSKGAVTGIAAAVVLEGGELASLFGSLGGASTSASGPRTLPFGSGSISGGNTNDIPVFNVVAYGADPTGTADSTAAIQAAIDAAIGNTSCDGIGNTSCAEPVGAVFLPAGNYRTTAPLTVIAVRGFHFYGSGIEQTQIQPDAPMTQALYINGSSWSTYENFSIVGGASGVCTDAAITLTWDGTVDVSSSQNEFRRITIRNLTCVNGINLASNNQNDGNTFYDCTITGGNTYPGTISGTYWLNGFLFGGGSYGNNLNQLFFGCSASHWGNGFNCNISTFGIYGGELSNNTVDFLIQGTSNQCSIEQINSENGGQFVVGPMGGSSWEGLAIRDCTWSAYLLASPYKVIQFDNYGPLMLDNFQVNQNESGGTPIISAPTGAQITALNCSMPGTPSACLSPGGYAQVVAVNYQNSLAGINTPLWVSPVTTAPTYVAGGFYNSGSHLYFGQGGSWLQVV
jgi:thiosulfate dehydrogenase (quinone) large subunit